MCKVLIMPAVKPEHQEKAVKFVKEMGKEMSSGNTDGLGYAAIDKDGKLFGQRWLVNRDAFGGFTGKKLKSFEKALSGSVSDTESERNTFGEDPNLNRMVAITLHTRMATTPKNMQNVHPFVYDEVDTSLIHNGVIQNHEEFKKSVSTCDSESILFNYIQEGVNLNPEAMKKVSQNLNGYYACGVFSRDVNKNRILDVFKGNNPNLYLQEIKELETYVFATNDDDVKRVCDRLGLTKGESYRVLEGHLMRINPFTGEVLLMETFTAPAVTSRTYSHYNNDRGSTPRTNPVTDIRGWQKNHSRHSGNTDSDDTGMGTIVDASVSGARERAASEAKPKGSMSEDMRKFMELKPKIRELPRQEVVEETRSFKMWGSGKRA